MTHGSARLFVASALMLAAGLHVHAAWEHAALGWLHTMLFGLAAAVQAGAAVLVLAGGSPRLTRALAGANGIFLAAWLLSRTVGLPVLAPVPEPAALRDILAASGAAIALAGLLWLATGERPRGFVARRVAGGAVVVLAMLTFTTNVAGAFGDTGHGAHATHVAGPGSITDALAGRSHGDVHVHGLGGPDRDPGQTGAARADARVLPTGSLPTAIVATGDAVWVANRGGGDLSRVDPVSLTVETILVGGSPAAVAVGFGSVWVADFSRDVVLRVDSRTGEILGRPIAVEPGPAALAVDESGVWVAGVQEGTVQRIDPVTLETDRPLLVGYGPIALAADGAGGIWVLNTLDRAMVRLDASTGELGIPVPVPASASDLLIAFDRLWVAASSAGTVTPFDPATGHRRGPELVADALTDAGRGPTGLAAGKGRLWVANNHDMTVRGVDPHALTLTPPETFSDRLGSGPIAVRATYAFGALWVTDFDAGSVVRVAVGR